MVTLTAADRSGLISQWSRSGGGAHAHTLEAAGVATSILPGVRIPLRARAA